MCLDEWNLASYSDDSGVINQAPDCTDEDMLAEMFLLPAWALGGFERPAQVNPVIAPAPQSVFIDPMSKKPLAWEASDTFNPAAVIYRGKVVVLYRAEDHSGEGIGQRTSRLGLAESSDGLKFKRYPAPVLYPDVDSQKENEWAGGCEDPRLAVTEDGTFVVFYTQWNRNRARLAVATSRDLRHWKKAGPAFKHDAPDLSFTKSASPITKIVNDRQVLAKIQGKYWMYWGEQAVYAATSTDLVTWTPVRNADGTLKKLIEPRAGYFDSDLTECGPPAVITDHGIVLLYNGKNDSGDKGDKRFAGNAYCAGQVLFSAEDPTKPLDRLNVPFLKPTQAFEKSGQYKDGTVFIEGLVWFKKRWFLYYGCADSRVSVAVFDPQKPAPDDPTLSK